MNESELLEELRALRPAAPSARLGEAIARDLNEPQALTVQPASGVLRKSERRFPGNWWPNLAWAGAGAFAAWIALGFPGGMPQKQAKAPLAAANSAAVFEPLDASREVISSEEGAVNYDDEAGPTKLVRYSSIERHAWANAATGAQVEVEIPREDVFVVPVSYQ